MLALVAPAAAGATLRSDDATAHRLVTGLEGGSGSTIGPDGALYVTENAAGRITRVDPRTGATTTFASGLPKLIPAAGFGGPVDIAFLGRTAYVLVTLVGSDVGGSDVVGIYRVDGPDRFTVVADIGAFSIANPPATDFFVPSGVQYALQAYRGGFLVTDGHHNRVLRVSRGGQISELRAFGNIVPTGLEVRGRTIYMAEAGPVPHLPEDGKVVAFRPKSTSVREVASGSPLLVDVEFGPRHRLYALSQGDFQPGNPEGSPALPNTGALVKAGRDGTFTVVIDRLNQPTSLEFIGKTAYVVTLGGEIWKIAGVQGPPHLLGAGEPGHGQGQ
ncbi:MAG TPA: ScyD/ScyE family protein [Actinomycetota bacterium]|nr:ScyD/ScyE family protein [Actinomycetota bacterium]